MVSASRLVAIVSPESAPIKRIIQDARERGTLIDATYGRRTRAVIITDSDHVSSSRQSSLRRWQTDWTTKTRMWTMNNTRGLLVVVSGPSGVGKGTIMRPFMERNQNVKYSVSATTRAPREGEIDGVNYHFVTKEQFENLIENDEMLEYARYSGNYYGTPRFAVEKNLAAGLDVVLEIEVKGAQQVRRRCPEAISVFIMPPSFQELSNRLHGRNTESEEKIMERLDIARSEMQLAYDYDFILVNDDVDEAVRQLEVILEAAKAMPKYMKDFIDEVNNNA